MSKRIGKIGEQVFTTTANASWMVVMPVSTADETRLAESTLRFTNRQIAKMRELSLSNSDLTEYAEAEIAKREKDRKSLERELIELSKRGAVSWVRRSVHGYSDLARKAARLSKNRSELDGYETQVIELR
jgi:hypothetical protein